ncbi:alanine--tRNA ligase [candidate division WWE3 bacterium]|uniref:alanine--tRNA ligase n=1 Tax=candidate division WWE3 bacterium TaxID=2053526 RepID=A0A955J1K2_UNCKA|nr:alanine--tRNA ligase [candidate division WWE3 bacterium]
MKTTQQILEAFLNFYNEKGHYQIPNVPLVPENDPSLLFVNSGMFPLVPYLTGEVHPEGTRLMNVQRCIRFEDLEEIGDSSHTLGFHMIGNWSLNDYFKKEQLPWVYELFVEHMGLDVNRMYATVFEGDNDAPVDQESIDILKEVFAKYGIDAKVGERIFPYGKKENWWQRGEAVGELGGPDSEIHYYLGEGNGNGKNPVDNDDEFLEIGNSVFMQYKMSEEGWKEIPQKNVDFGGGLERLVMVSQNKRDIFETDSFAPIVNKIEQLTGKKYDQDMPTTIAIRIVADHIRTATFMAMDGVTPSNKEQGYMLRRLLRRMIRQAIKLGVAANVNLTSELVPTVVTTLNWLYPQLNEQKHSIMKTFEEEETKFKKLLDKGERESIKELEKVEELNTETLATIAFNLFQSIGYPAEIFAQDAKDKFSNLNEQEFNTCYQQLFDQHQQQSRAGAEHKFKGGLADSSEQTVKYHTTTHLLHWALRKVLGEQVEQKGSNITGERLRFDFSHNDKLTEEQLRQVENLINEKISEELPVNMITLPIDEAEKTGALHFFGEKYGETVNVYYIGEDLDSAFSKEFCGGPHVSNTKELSKVEIFKQKSIGENLIRVYLHTR